MDTETPEKVTRDMIARADILATMGEQPLSSLKVIEQLKKFAERRLNAKPDEHAARMDTENSSEQMRDLLRKVAVIAEEALSNQPNEEVPRWEHLRSALGQIETEMLIHTAEKPEGDSPAEAQSRREKKAIGNFAGAGKVVSYAIDENFAVTVTARTNDGHIWSFKGIKNGEMVIMGTILGGRGTAEKYCQFIRNGIVSRLMKIKQNHARRAEKAARTGAAASTND